MDLHLTGGTAMNQLTLSKRLSALEVARATAPVRLAAEDAEAAAARYEASLCEPEEPDPQHAAYLAGRSLVEIAADYDAMLKGAPAPWR